MAEDWDLYAIVRSCTSATHTTTSKANRTSNTNTIKSESFENPLDCLAALTFEVENDPFSFPDLVQPRNICLQELQDSYKPFLASSITSGGQGNILSSSISDFERFSAPNQPQLALQHHHQHQQQQIPTNIVISPHFNDTQNVQQPHLQQQNQRQQQLHQLQGTQRTNNPVLPLRPMQAPAARLRKKKSNQKRLVMHVTAENLSNDEWAWRKYGQKPIKGSPYPRNYYRCSSSKGCAARKQVERSNTDPTLFIVSYTGDHTHPRPTHRNSLAGSTRNKFPAIQKPINKESEAAAVADHKGSCSSPLSATSLSPRTPLSAPVGNEAAAATENNININKNIATDDLESDYDCDVAINYGEEDEDDDDDDDDDNEDILIPNMALNEDLVKGFEELGSRGDQLGHSPAFGDNFSSWVVGGSAAAAGATTGGGY